MTVTFIAGSTATGETMPPHFQFPTRPKLEERHKLSLEISHHTKNTPGVFGNYGKGSLWPVTVGLNERGGMDDKEFQAFLNTSVIPLFPDV